MNDLRDQSGSPERHPAGAATLRWQLLRFDESAPTALYAILAARVDVFVVEQACPYPELDGLDDGALHLVAWAPDGDVAAYARILPPGVRFDRPSIGRVLTTAGYRGTGLGRALMRRAIAATRQRWPASDIRISAQCHLERFYRGLGFRVESSPYDEDGIPHIDMRLPGEAEPGIA